MKIVDCKMNHIENPLGYEIIKPVFTWKVIEANGKFQKAARICIATDGQMENLCTDTGMKEDLDCLGTEIEVDLKPRTRYFWTVSVQTDAGEEATSDVNWFETAKMGEPWKAKWISCEDNNRHPIFEKEIQIMRKVKSARLYISGLGLYEAYLNGVKVGNEYMTPYCNNYEEWIQYQTYDVTKELQKDVVLSVITAPGWAIGRFGFMSKPGDPGEYRDHMELIAELRIVYDDGIEEVIGTDDNWSVRRSNFSFSNIYDGEHRDDTLPETKNEKCFLIEETTPLVARYSLPVLAQEEFCPIELIHTPSGEQVFDVGQNMAGIFRLRVNEPKGTVIRLKFGEVLQGGNFYSENLRTAIAEYVYVSAGKEIVIEPHFTFYGYRYVKVEGISDLKVEDFVAIALYSDTKEIGKLTTGHEKVNRLIKNTEWGLKGNFLDVPTDCPQRDERMGWTGDASVFSATSCFLRENYAFYRKFLYDMATEQKNLNGKVPNVIPSFVKEIYRDTGSVWGDAATIIPWNMYLLYGDISILKERYEEMKAWVDYIGIEDGDDHGWRRRFHNGDWLALDNAIFGADRCVGGTDTGYIADNYYAQSAQIVAKVARLLGKEEDALKYEKLAARIRKDLVEEYFSPTGRCCINTQTALLLALHFGVAPNREKAKEMLVEKFEDTNGKLQTGFVGTPLLCKQLTEEGLEGMAYDLLLNEEFPGWLHEVNMGATTMWERWNSLNEDGTVSSTGMNSFNHYAYGSIVEWMYRYMAGLNPVEVVPGFREVEVKPFVDRRMDFVDMSYDSAAGKYKVYWKVLDNHHISLKITVPFDCKVIVKLPHAPESVYMQDNPMFADVKDGVCRLCAGSYEVTYETSCALGKVYTRKNTLEQLRNCTETRKVLERMVPRLVELPEFLLSRTLEELSDDKEVDLYYVDLLDEIEMEFSKIV